MMIKKFNKLVLNKRTVISLNHTVMGQLRGGGLTMETDCCLPPKTNGPCAETGNCHPTATIGSCDITCPTQGCM